MKTPKLPTYGHHKPTGQARCYVDRKTIYLGKFGSEESRIRYSEIVARVVSGVSADPFVSKSPNPETAAGLTINELVLAFMRYAEGHYTKNGVPTSEISCLTLAWKPLVEMHGFTPVDSFGPLMLKSVRQKFVEAGWVRNSCNSGVNRIRRIFRWGVESELVDPSTLARLEAVAPLLRGRTEAADNAPRSSVDDARIEAVQSLVRPLTADLISLQRLTGARSGELLSLTTGMIDRTGEVWVAALADHKTRHHGQDRTLHFGPQAQIILAKYLSADSDVRLFGITRLGYSQAVLRACDKAGIERWCPHQMRNTAAANVRETFGLEFAQSVLGHSSTDMTEKYARASSAKAAEVAARIG